MLFDTLGTPADEGNWKAVLAVLKRQPERPYVKGFSVNFTPSALILLGYSIKPANV